MRRYLLTALTAPVFALTACGGQDAEPQVQEPDSAPATESPTSEEPATETTEEATETTTEDTATETTAPPPDDASDTSAGGEAMGGKEGQAAADRTEEFLIALVNADPKLCDTMLNLQSTAPMKDSPDDLKMCQDELIPTLDKQMKGLLPEGQAEILDDLEINGAKVDGDTATVTEDNYDGAIGKGFAQGFGQDVTLQNVEGEWYVDFQKTFQP